MFNYSVNQCFSVVVVFSTIFFCFLVVAKRLSEVLSSPRQSIRNAAEGSLKKVLPGVVVTSSRSSRRRISSAAATQAFAVATSGESPKGVRYERLPSSPGRKRRNESIWNSIELFYLIEVLDRSHRRFPLSVQIWSHQHHVNNVAMIIRLSTRHQRCAFSMFYDIG